MKKVVVAIAVILWSLMSLAGLAKADSIAVGQLSYLGTTPDGASIFKVSLSPPTGISLTSLVPSIYIGDNKLTFVLPTSSDFLFITGPGTPFANCPCANAHFDFFASPGTTLTLLGQTMTLKRHSHSFLKPAAGEDSLLPQQSTTIYLATVPGRTSAGITLTSVPEPGTLALVVIGLGMILFWGISRRTLRSVR